MNNHLMDPILLFEFAAKMWLELQIHKKEKEPLKNVKMEKVVNICTKEIKDRVKILKKKTISTEEAKKQLVHIANYTFILHSRILMDKK